MAKDYKLENGLLFERLDQSYERILELTCDGFKEINRFELVKYSMLGLLRKKFHRDDFEEDVLKECKRFQKVLNEIILLNRPLIYPIVRYYAACKQIDYDDLVQEGIFALRRAAIGFDRGRGIKFSTYANPWIRQIIQRSIAYNKTIRVPIHIALLGERIETIGRLNFRKGVKQLTLEELQEIALKYGWGIKKMRTAIEVTYQKHISLEDKVDNEDKITDPSNKLPGITGQISVEDLYATIETNYIFMKNLATLSPKMEYVMRKRFIDNYTLEHIAMELNVTRERIRQIENSAKRRLKAKFLFRDSNDKYYKSCL